MLGATLGAVLGTTAALVPAAARGEPAGPPPQGDGEAWQAFRDRFVLPEGRVADTGNAGVSHTEGQGWGLLFAENWDDRATFDRLLEWTRRTLRRPGDALHAWRYVPGAAVPVADPNNATDGDLFIAWALSRAAIRWRRPELAAEAAAIARDVLGLLVTTVAGRTVLLPGAEGFRREDGVVLNPSYYAFPALDALAGLVPDPRWAALRRDGVALLDQGRFGRWGLPADWVWAGADGAVRPAPGFPPRYGFDAVRVPLYLAWGRVASPARAAVAEWWRAGPEPRPAWVDLVSGEVAPFPANPGMAAAAGLAAGLASGLAAGTPEAVAPRVEDGMDYYTAALCLLTRMAAHELSAGRSGADRR